MILLLIVSFIWAFSFGLVKRLAGLDPTAIAAVRLAISLAVFLPFLRAAKLGSRHLAALAAIGAVQFGAVYILYLRAYAHLHAYEIALFTITTPIFVAVVDALLERRWKPRFLSAAALSVAGAGVVLWKSIGDSGVIGGFVLMQLSNICFACGQVAWRRERAKLPAAASDASVFAVTYAGALALTLGVSAFTTSWGQFAPTGPQWVSIAYLGAVASGLAFFLWNVGATRVNAGVLAAFNNVKIPLGIAVSLVFFGEKAELGRLLVGGVLMAVGVWTARARPATSVS
jgi:drug/metabolite transporter (DMT)-like permease